MGKTLEIKTRRVGRRATQEAVGQLHLLNLLAQAHPFLVGDLEGQIECEAAMTWSDQCIVPINGTLAPEVAASANNTIRLIRRIEAALGDLLPVQGDGWLREVIDGRGDWAELRCCPAPRHPATNIGE